MLEWEFRSYLLAILALEPRVGLVAQSVPAVQSAVDLLREAISGDAAGWVGDSVRRQWHELAVARPERAATLLHALGWLAPSEVSGWGGAVAREAREHPSLCVRAAAVRALSRWATPEAIGILRGGHEPDPALGAEIVAALDELEIRASAIERRLRLALRHGPAPGVGVGRAVAPENQRNA